VRSATAAVLAASVALAAPAGAQTKTPGFALDRFDPSVPVDAFFGVGSPSVGGHLVPRGTLEMEYASRPLQVEVPGMGTTNVVGSQGYLHAGVSLPLWDRLLLSVDVPIAVVDSGASPMTSGLDYHVPSSATLGDVRLGVRGRFWGKLRDPFQIGLGGAVLLPTGSPDAYTGQGAARGTVDLLMGGRAGTGLGVVWSATAGTMLQGARVSPLLRYGAGAAVVIGEDRLQIGPELYGSTELGNVALWTMGQGFAAGSGSEIEILLGAKGRLFGGFFLGAAGGFAPIAAVGAPGVRFVGTASWAPLTEDKRRAPSRDRDGDGIADDVDACPDVKGELQNDPSKDGCPIADRDHDGIPDVDDACPLDPGPRNPDPTKNGCPLDTDDDGIPDAVDACPTVKGVKNPDPKKNGCPIDSDGDGIPDALDACPDVPGVKSADPKLNGCPDDPDGDGIKGAADACPFEKGPADPDRTKNGCPRFVRVGSQEIKILAQIQFKFNGKARGDTVSPVSDELMKEIRDVIQQHPEIVKIEVQGHTDDDGTEAYNMRLSRERADAVREWLIAGGIPAAKLVARGYGSERPLADNRIKKGRGLNRRVQFVILEKK
jgi:outer membrane protein OmpA-like peptidoglycan-associated protein